MKSCVYFNKGYLKKVVEWFRMYESMLVGTHIGHRSKFSIIQTLNFEEGIREVNNIPHANGVGNTTYECMNGV